MERFKDHSTEGEWIDTEHNVVTYGDFRCQHEGTDPVSAWTQMLGDTAALMQLCPWYLKQLEDEKLGYINSDALNVAKALSTNLPPSTLIRPLTDGRPQIDYFDLADFTILHEVCITAVSCTNEGRS
jgi:hypothetical protein